MKIMGRIAKVLAPAINRISSSLVEQSADSEQKAPSPIKFNYPSGQSTPITSSWTTQPTSPGRIVYEQLSAIRARSRQQYRASDYIKRFAKLVKSNIVGPNGITYNSFARDINGDLDLELAYAVEKEVRSWFATGVDYYREQAWADMLGTVATNLAIDGEVFGRLRVSNNNLSVQLIDPELIRVNDFRTLRNGNYVRFGIEFNRQDRIVAYYIWPTYGYGFSGVPTDSERNEMAQPIRVPARNMLHLFEKEHVGLLRGIPWTATSISRTWQMEKWDEAALVNARYGASKMVFFTSPDGLGIYDAGQWPNGYRVTKIAPGQAEMLPEGVEPVAFDPQYPSNEYESFSSRNLRGAASGLNVAYESLANDRVGVNFSSIRAGVQEDRESWRALQQFVIRNWCEPIITRYQLVNSLNPDSVFGMLTDYPGQAEDVSAHKWQPRTWAPVDPMKDISASEKEIQMGVKSRTQHMVEMGRDPVETWEQIRKEKEVMDSLGIGPIEDTEIEDVEVEVEDNE